MNEPVLVIMAAGMGSRFGGLKQITPVDDGGHMIIDFSLFDAKRAGFKKVVFIIKHEIEDIFKERIGRRMEKQFDVHYVYQELNKIPEGYTVPEGRTKPWGTGHAIACAADAIDGPFAVINSDDFYGYTAIKSIYDFLSEDHAPSEHAMVGYMLKKTVTENGYVSRGICEVENSYLRSIVECVHIEKRGEDAEFTEDGETWIPISGSSTVSMNMWGFRREILEQFRPRFVSFLNTTAKENPLKAEFYLPFVANCQLQENLGTVRVLPTEEQWYGVTYPEDLQSVRDAISEMKVKGIYPDSLWV